MDKMRLRTYRRSALATTNVARLFTIDQSLFVRSFLAPVEDAVAGRFPRPSQSIAV